MDAVRERIKGYVLTLDPTIPDNDYLDLIVREVVDRALVYMNRGQFVARYEELVAIDYDFVANHYDAYPIPLTLETSLASTVTKLIKTNSAQQSADNTSIKKITDGRQSVEYGDKPTSFMITQTDTEVFAGIVSLMDNFRVPTVVDNP